MADADLNVLKRKRNDEETGYSFTMSTSAPHNLNPAPVVINPINYLCSGGKNKIPLISGDPDGFRAVLNRINEYQGILRRHESLAANMGAKLVGSLLLKSVDKLFEGPIKISSKKELVRSITWHDLIEAARQTPKAFVLMTDERTGGRFCHVWIKDTAVEILEDDYRLILSGAPERMIPSQPLPEDELAELGTIDILEHRLLMVVKNADSVAAEARILKRNLQNRRTAIQQYQTVNGGQSLQESQSIHQELMRQFAANERQDSGSIETATHSCTVRQSSDSSSGPRTTQVKFLSPDNGTGGLLRPIMTLKVERLSKGDSIYPPCDRCRRLHLDCTKHLTACDGCTKKHARCAWKDITEHEEQAVASGDDKLAFEPKMPLIDSSLNANLDPGLRVNGALATIGGMAGDGQIFVGSRQDDGGGREEGDAILEHQEMLGHIASEANNVV